MSYNVAPDRTADFIFQGLNAKATSAHADRAHSAQQMRDITNTAMGVADVMGDWDKRIAQMKGIQGQMEALQAIGPQVGITQEDLEAVGKIKDPDKLAGALTMYSGLIDARQREAYLNAQMKQSRDLAAYRAQLSAAGRNHAASLRPTAEPTHSPITVSPNVNIW